MKAYFENNSIAEVLEKCRDCYGDSPAVVTVKNGELFTRSFREMERDCAKFAARLKELGMRGKYVAIDAKNDYATVVAILGAMAGGAVAFPLNFDLPDDIIESAVTRLKPALFFCHDENEEFAREMDFPEELEFLTEEELTELLDNENAPEFRDNSLTCDSPCLVLLTSGSTGEGKLVLQPHRQFNPGTLWWCERGLSACPLFHSFGFVLLMEFIGAGAPIMLSDVKHAAENINLFKPANLMGVPAYLANIIKQQEAGRVNLECLKLVINSGAPSNPEVLQRFKAMGVEVHDEYGATEMARSLGRRIRGGDPAGSVGYVGRGGLVKIGDEDEILVEKSHALIEYIGNRAATEAVFEGNYFRTGDKGKIVDGFLYITGRIKNIIILSNGENVSPETIENYFSAYGEIAEIIAKGGSDDIIEAHIFPGEDLPETLQKIREIVAAYNKTVPAYYKIGKIVFRNEPFEKTPNGKILRSRV